MASSAAEISPPVDDSATAMVSFRAFRRAAMVSARGSRSCMVVILRMGPVGRPDAAMLYGAGDHFDGEDMKAKGRSRGAALLAPQRMRRDRRRDESEASPISSVSRDDRGAPV